MKVVDRVAAGLARGVRGWMAVAAVVLFAVFTATVLPAQAEAGAFYTVRYAAPDTSLWYSPDDLYAAAEAWGPDGRAAYVYARLTFDVIWPPVYGAFLVATLAWVGLDREDLRFFRSLTRGRRTPPPEGSTQG